MSAKTVAILCAGLIVVVGVVLLVDRGGLVAWGGVFIGAALLAKISFKPSRLDLGLSAGFAMLFVLAWVGTFYYVISTWESGEVVELVIDTNTGPHSARVWVLDVGDDPVVYYDAEPEVAESLLAGRPVQFTRGGKVSTRIPEAGRFDALSEKESNLIFEAMGQKYGDRNDATEIYYSMLGSSRDRVAVVASLSEM